ncbi:uncharacterized protein LOC142240464 [Haematobia irritans]|uniref:uncharacterized protein LOC142240464 n=1 Tax=Haematobia irritans TaxID=7368 RepID=UPI003F4FAB48
MNLSSHHSRNFFGHASTSYILVWTFFLLVAATSFASGKDKTSDNTNFWNSANIIEKPSGILQNTMEAEARAKESIAVEPFFPLMFSWGHVTKYSNILYDQDIKIKGPIEMDVTYPGNDEYNTYTIIGIQIYDNNDANQSDYHMAEDQMKNLDFKIFPIKGGVGYNFTVIHFQLLTNHELHYKLVIHGLDL